MYVYIERFPIIYIYIACESVLSDTPDIDTKQNSIHIRIWNPWWEIIEYYMQGASAYTYRAVQHNQKTIKEITNFTVSSQF